jgi:type II secretory pathway pseudopilin PulG
MARRAMMTPERTTKHIFLRSSKCVGYTLFEILLALGIVAVVLGVTIPMLMNSFGATESEQITQSIEKLAQETRRSAEEKGETLRLQIRETGIYAGKGFTSFDLPREWRLKIKRFTDNRFRKPEKLEFWEFNSAGICDPIEIQLVNQNTSFVLQFDPLTALIVENNE